MARSRRKTPIAGVAADSDKTFKVIEHRRARRAVKVALEAGAEVPPTRSFGDPWNGSKDGKRWFGDRWPEGYRK
ncbi:hypothetical protein [Filomicrobium sp.]|uniref:hypothetical protein n=1 Tax=Filomicrobium sp. TaxID=2024831 RepID=UPI0025857E0D|nr:hypothetical protein [Filomicrobium sp.]MCV0369524.1 hypothetical protein [Filomicrobium sp.]